MSAGETPRLARQMTAEERARLVAALDHDVRQPQHSIEMGLRTLRLLTADLRARGFDEESMDFALHRFSVELTSLQAAHRQAIDLQNDLLDAMRLDVDEQPPHPRTISAGDLLDRICKSNRGLAEEIELRAARTRLTFYSDERWVERILNNLVTNAIRHSRATKILVGARSHGGNIVFEIRDNGDGITSDKLSNALRPPQAVSLSEMDLARVRRGLGLYNVQVLAERLCGQVRCSSFPGRGSLFTISFPGPLGVLETRSRPVFWEAATEVRNKLVAVLDDEPAALRSTERLLEAIGVQVYADSDPLRWLSVVTDMPRPPDLILLDYELGDHDCSLQLEIVRRRWGGELPKVLVLTGAPLSPGLLKVASLVPVVRKPLTDEAFELFVSILIGRGGIPDRGLLNVPCHEQ